MIDLDSHQVSHYLNDASNSTIVMRPAAIYSSMFVWNAITGGRFIAPYLHVAHHLKNSTSIGTIIATQFFVASLLSGWGGQIADSMERAHPLKGRIIVLVAGMTLGACSFSIESADYFFPSLNRLGLFMWHLYWRMVYSIAAALTGPVLDGLTLAHLKREREENRSSSLQNGKYDWYGRERLHGAIWWGIGNVVIGYSIDRWGFKVLNSLTIVSTLLSYVTICLYYLTQSQNREATSLVNGNRAEGHSHQGYHEVEANESNVQSNECTPLRKKKETSTPSLDEQDITLKYLFSLLFSTPQNTGFIIAYCLLNVGFAVIENLIFLFYQSVLGSSYTM